MKKTIIAILAFYVVLSLFNYSYIYEDAFIFFRVAEYISNGFGYVFNPGERAEVCSSLSWLFLLTLFHKLGANILITSQILGIFFGCCSLVLIHAITARFTPRTSQQALPAFLTALSLPFLMWNQMGCETSLYTMVFLALLLVCLDRKRFGYWPLPAAVLALTRPEGLFLTLAVVPALWCYRDQMKRVIFSMALCMALFLIILTARFWYFGDLLPTAFYVKIYSGKYLAGLEYVHSHCKDYFMYYLCALLLFFVWRPFNWREERFILFGFIVVHLTWVVLGGAEPKIYYRHVIPLIPLLYIYISTGVEHGLGNFTAGKKWALNLGMVAFGCAGLLLPRSYWIDKTIENPVMVSALRFWDNPSEHARFCLDRLKNPAAHNYIDNNAQLIIGEFIKRNYFSGTTILYDQMGQTPYQAGLDYVFIDSWGLTDTTIGRYYFHERNQGSALLRFYERLSTRLIKRFHPRIAFIDSRRQLLDYVFERSPDVIMFFGALRTFEEFLPNWLSGETRFKEQYSRKYLICGTFVYEKKGLNTRPRYIPEGLSATYR